MGVTPSPSPADWAQLRTQLSLHQRMSGVVVWVPRPGAIGFGVDLGLPVRGFVDVTMLTNDVTAWPTVGTAAEFEVWWFDERPEIRLKPMDTKYLRADFDAWVRRWRPDWIDDVAARPRPD